MERRKGGGRASKRKRDPEGDDGEDNVLVLAEHAAHGLLPLGL